MYIVSNSNAYLLYTFLKISLKMQLNYKKKYKHSQLCDFFQAFFSVHLSYYCEATLIKTELTSRFDPFEAALLWVPY